MAYVHNNMFVPMYDEPLTAPRIIPEVEWMTVNPGTTEQVFQVSFRYQHESLLQLWLNPDQFHDLCTAFSVASLGADFERQQWLNDQAEKDQGHFQAQLFDALTSAGATEVDLEK